MDYGRRGTRVDSTFTPARLQQAEEARARGKHAASPFLAFCAKALSPITLRTQQPAEGRFLKTPAPPALGSAPPTAGASDGGVPLPRRALVPASATVPLSLPLMFGLPSAVAPHRAGGGAATALLAAEPASGGAAHALTSYGLGGMALSLESPRPRDSADPAAHAFASRQAGAAAAGTAAKSLRRTLVESPRSAQARRRCLTFDTPRGGRPRGRLSLSGTGARTPQGGAFATPAPLSRRARGRPSLDGAPPSAGLAPPETPDLGGALDGTQRSGAPGSAGGSCRRCRCIKSKCLKLYCECFAAGAYCDAGDGASCSCQNCLNTQDNAALVAHTRAQIEMRNPLAFCPKIVSKPLGEDTEMEETPRHKKGCHCKKSACLKKYCECFQAGVLCTDACRCDGCKNCGPGGSGGGARGPFTLPVPAASAPMRSSLRAVGASPITPAVLCAAAAPLVCPAA